MNKKLTTRFSILLMAMAALFTSCNIDDDNDKPMYLPTALVTVKPTADSFILQLDDSTRLLPANMSKSPFGDKEVRALVNYKIAAEKKSDMQSVHINWIDSIRTKMTVPSLGDKNNETYGNDPVDIMKDWVTVAEDGYLTLRLRTLWGNSNKVHHINLLTGTNPKNPYELELRHNANGDTPMQTGDALIAFNLRDVMADAKTDKVKFTLRWNSFSGMKTLEFDLKSKPMDSRSGLSDAIRFASSVK